jgi:hypothetical protein
MRTIAAVALIALVSCKRSEDEAAKQRIFSPEQPVGTLPEAKESLDARKLADDRQLAARVLHMRQREISQRIGARKAQQRVQFAWFRGPGLPDGGSEASLAEETTLLAGPDDDFAVRLSNDHNQGFELLWVKTEVFVKSLYGPFRKRRTDRSDPQRVRDQAMGGLATFDRLARGLKLKVAGEVTAEGRKVIRYTVTGFGARGSDEKAQAQGAAVTTDPDTARRLELWDKEEPVSVSGTVLVDLQTAAPLGCDLRGHFKVSGAKEGPAAELDLHSVLTTTAIGRDPGLKTPAFEPEPSAPHAVKDPLRFLGKGPAAGPKEEEADDTDEEDATPAR